MAGHPTYHVNVIKLKWEIIWTGRVTSSKRDTLATWGPPPSCKQAGPNTFPSLFSFRCFLSNLYTLLPNNKFCSLQQSSATSPCLRADVYFTESCLTVSETAIITFSTSVRSGSSLSSLVLFCSLSVVSKIWDVSVSTRCLQLSDLLFQCKNAISDLQSV